MNKQLKIISYDLLISDTRRYTRYV